MLIIANLDHRTPCYGTGWQRLSFATGLIAVSAIVFLIAWTAPL